jgi:hypothetical protein
MYFADSGVLGGVYAISRESFLEPNEGLLLSPSPFYKTIVKTTKWVCGVLTFGLIGSAGFGRSSLTPAT